MVAVAVAAVAVAVAVDAVAAAFASASAADESYHPADGEGPVLVVEEVEITIVAAKT